MGKRYIEHSGMCGCERCALAWEGDDPPRRVYDCVEDPDYLDCGCRTDLCDCAYWEDFE